MRRVVLAAALMASLAGCGALPLALGVAASASTLLKNEFNCSLADTASCTLPKLALPQVP